MDDFWRKEEKLAWFAENNFQQIEFDNITPDKNNNWINISENDWENLLPLISVQQSFGRKSSGENSIFQINTLGVNTARDSWVYDFDKKNLENKMDFFIRIYKESINKGLNLEIKWSHVLKNYFNAKKEIKFDINKIIEADYRPFTKMYLYADFGINDTLNNKHLSLFTSDFNKKNVFLSITNPGSGKPFMTLANTRLADFHFVGAAALTQCLPLYRYTSTGERVDNITDWGLQQFKDHYQPSLRGTKQGNEQSRDEAISNQTTNNEIVSSQPNTKSKAPRNDVESNTEITKEDIFHYTYAVLHNPAYRKKYELNLKREFPRIPFYENFFQWRDWGKQLINLHINYETVEPYPLQQKEVNTKEQPKTKLKALKETSVIQLDENTELHGIPKQAWEYKLGNRSALEWILDQYKEKKPTDPTIAEKFNTYKFADYKEKVIDLLKRVCTVSVETMKIVKEMPVENE